MKAEALGADCSHCTLRDAPMVPTLWPSSPPPEGRRLVVVGEAPGFVEATYGKPFTGPSGKLINQVLAHHGIKRSEVAFTNACLCRPQDNATPDRTAVAACRGRLANELVRFGATDVLALGATAGTLLVDDPGTITTLRVGAAKKPARFLTNAGVSSDLRVVPTWHPAYCLRNADAFPALVNDVGKLYSTKYRTWTEPDFIIADDEESALYYIDRLMTGEGLGVVDKLVVDIEVGIDKDTDFDHPNNFDLLCIGVAYAYNQAIVFGEKALGFQTVLDALRKLFKSKKLIGHNGKFDLAGLFPKFGVLELWFDTMLASYTLDERPGNHGLKVLAVEKLGAPKYDDEIKKYVPRRGNYADIPRPILYRYNAFDVACTWALFEIFVEQMDKLGNRHVHDFMVEAANQLMFLELNGIAIDKEYSNQLGNEYLERLEELEAKMDEIVKKSTGHLDTPITSINPRSPKQIMVYLESQGVRVASTNADTLETLLERMPKGTARHAFVAVLLRYRYEHKRYSTYIVGIRKRMYRGRVYTTYLLHGTTSGRLASRNPNLQNIVRDSAIRRQFAVSHPDNVLIQCDYANAEARVMATLAQDEYLREILSNQTPGYKFFNELSDQLYGEGQWGKEEYIRTKAYFYGIAYGREAYSIAMEYGLSPSEAQSRYDAFTGLFPGVMKWQEDVWKRVRQGQPLVSPFGRQRHFFLITEQNKKDTRNEALSYLPQSTASDICLRALVRVRPMLRGLGFLRLTIHDALVAECHEEKSAEVAELLSSIMADEGRRFTDYVPFPVDTSVGKSWGDL